MWKCKTLVLLIAVADQEVLGPACNGALEHFKTLWIKHISYNMLIVNILTVLLTAVKPIDV